MSAIVQMEPETDASYATLQFDSPPAYHRFPLTIGGIHQLDIKEWQKDFCWPLSWPQFLKLEVKVTNVMDSYIRKYKGHFLSDLISINYKCYIDCVNLIHELVVLKDLKRKQIEPLLVGSERYRQLVENGVPSVALVAVPSTGKKFWFERKIKNLKIARRLFGKRILLSFLKPKIYVTDASLSDFTISHLRKSFPGRVKALCFDEWTRDQVRVSEDGKQEICDFCEDFINEIGMIARAYDLHLTEQQSDFLRENTERLFLNSYELVLRADGFLKKKKPVSLFIGSNNNTLSRILSVAVRKNGGKVTAFSHGEPLAYNWKKIAWMELALADEYVEYSPALAETLAESSKFYPPANGNQSTIIGGGFKLLKSIREREKQKNPPEKIETVMLIGNAYRETGLSCVTSFPAPVQFDLERRIIELLRQFGYKVVYKKHPGGLLGKKELDFKIPNLEIISDSFEENLDKADAYFFYYTRTSTFGPALCTNKPIFVLDGGWEEIPEKMKRLLHSRCVFMEASFNERNLIELDEEDFQDLDRHLAKSLNTDFLDTFILNDSLPVTYHA